MELILFLAFLGVAAVGGLAYVVHQQDQKNRFARLGAVACGICGSEGVSEHGTGGYRCGACGYDTDVEQPPAKAPLVREIQELSIARTCLEGARRELDESRERVHTVYRDGKTHKEKIGPFHDRYLEGIEQSEEAIGILRRMVDEHPGLGPALEALGSIEPPPSGRTGFNAAVSAACAEVDQARAILDTERRVLVQTFRS